MNGQASKKPHAGRGEELNRNQLHSKVETNIEILAPRNAVSQSHAAVLILQEHVSIFARDGGILGHTLETW